MIRVDGSFGEGGGQILRTSPSLSLGTGKAFRIEKVRAGRERPGFLRQHLTAVLAAAEVGGTESSVETPASRLERTLSGLFTRDVGTNRPVLSIPLPESMSQERFTTAVSSLLNSLGRSASAASGGSIK